MDSHLIEREGFTLLELVLAAGVGAAVLTAVAVNGMSLINRARLEATVSEMNSIAEAAIEFYDSSSPDPLQMAWPAGLSDLVPQYLPHALTQSPFGNNYQLAAVNHRVTVSTQVPRGLAKDTSLGNLFSVVAEGGFDRISISRIVPNAFSGRLSYELKHPI